MKQNFFNGHAGAPFPRIRLKKPNRAGTTDARDGWVRGSG
jgi:hypothetical protein